MYHWRKDLVLLSGAATSISGKLLRMVFWLRAALVFWEVVLCSRPQLAPRRQNPITWKSSQRSPSPPSSYSESIISFDKLSGDSSASAAARSLREAVLASSVRMESSRAQQPGLWESHLLRESRGDCMCQRSIEYYNQYRSPIA